MAEYGGDRPEHYESDGTKSTDDFYTYGVTENEQSLQDVLERARDVEYARREVAAELECDVSEVF